MSPMKKVANPLSNLQFEVMKKVFKKLAKWDQKTIDWGKEKGLTEQQVGWIRIGIAVVVVVVVL